MPTLYRNFQTQAEIDAQYNAAQAVPDYARYMQHCKAASQQLRERVPCVLNVPYGATLAETLDIFPAEQANAPVFVFIHGGYWRALSSKDYSLVATGLRQRGFTTVVVDYALCPQVSIEEIVRQVRAAVAWTLRNIAAHGGDPARVVVGGHSAGGHLTAMCLQTAWAADYGLPQDPLAGAVLISGLHDLRPLRYSYLQPAIQLDEGIIQRCSPLFGVRASRTPAFVTWGGDESAEFARQAAAWHAAFTALGGTATLQPIAGTHHFSVIDGFEQPDSVLCNWIAQAAA
jgi:arylformamidase